MPSELERRGDFSQSFDTNDRLIVIRDPATGQPFPGNIIPTSRIDANGQALLNLFPVPNATDPRPAIQLHVPERLRAAAQRPGAARRLERRRRRRCSTRALNFGYEAYKGGWGFVLNNANWPQLPIAYEIHSYGVVNTLLHTFSPTTVARSDGRPQSRQADGRAADAGRPRAQRSHTASGSAGCRSSSRTRTPIASSRTPTSPRRAWRSANLPPRSASRAAIRSSARTTSGTRRPT